MRPYPTSDSQRSKVYNAEEGCPWNDRAKRRLSQDETRDLAAKAQRWLYDNDFTIGDRPPTLEFRNSHSGAATAYRGLNLIRFQSATPVAWVVLHEMAHLAYADRHPDFDGDRRSHGWVFCDVYLRLVSRFLGVGNAAALKKRFKDGKVQFRPKRTRTLTPEQRAAAAARLAAARSERGNTKAIEGVEFTWTARADGRREYRTGDGFTVRPARHGVRYQDLRV